MRSLALASLAVLAGCFEPIGLRAEGDNLCLVRSGIAVGVDAASGGLRSMPTNAVTTHRRIDYPLELDLLPAQAEPRLELTSFSLEAHDGNLKFMRELEVAVVAASGTEEELLPLMRYQSGTELVGTQVELQASNPIDLAPHVRNGVLVLDLGFVGEVPPAKLKLDVKTCFRASAMLRF